MAIGFEKITAENGICLRPIRWRDIPNFKKLLDDPDIVAAFQLFPDFKSAIKKWAASVVGVHYYKRQPFHYVIMKDGTAAGCLTFRDDGIKNEFTLSGLALLKRFRKKDTALCAFRAAAHYIDCRTPIERISAMTRRDNRLMVRAMRLAGFRETPESADGTLKAPARRRDPTLPVFEAVLDLCDPRIRRRYGLPERAP